MSKKRDMGNSLEYSSLENLAVSRIVLLSFDIKPRTYAVSGNATDDVVRFHILGDHGAGGNNRTTADCNTFQHGGSVADPDIVTDNDGLSCDALLIHWNVGAAEGVVCVADCHCLGDHHIAANANLGIDANHTILAEKTLHAERELAATLDQSPAADTVVAVEGYGQTIVGVIV